MFVVGLKKCNSTPAMVESSGIVSLEMMKICTAAEKKLLNNDDQSRNITYSGKSHQSSKLLNLHTDQCAESYSVGDVCPEQNSTNDVSTSFTTSYMPSNLGDRRLSQPCSYTSYPIKTTKKFGNNSDYACLQKKSSNQQSVRSNGLDISCSLPSIPLNQSFELHEMNSAKNTGDLESAKRCHEEPCTTDENSTSYDTHSELALSLTHDKSLSANTLQRVNCHDVTGENSQTL